MFLKIPSSSDCFVFINYNGTTSVVIYKNGSQVWSGTLNDVAGTFGTMYKPWVLGANWTSLSSKADFFKGKIDNVRIYDWNITADEVKEIYFNEAFEVGGNGESLGKMINSIIFVFRPVIDGIPISAESIEVEYDAEGFYQLRSNVPYSVSETKRSMIKSEDDVETEMYSALGKEEEKIIAYVLNEEGEFILSAVAKDDVNKTYLTISLEADHD